MYNRVAPCLEQAGNERAIAALHMYVESTMEYTVLTNPLLHHPFIAIGYHEKVLSRLGIVFG